VLLGVLAAVNAWLFWLRPIGGVQVFELEAASIGAGPTEQVSQGVALPLDDTCGGDPVRVFAGLDDQLFFERTIGPETSLRLALLDVGVEAATIDALEADVARVVHLGLVQGPLRVALDRDAGVSAIEVELAQGHLLQACRRGREFDVRQIRHPLRTDVTVVGLQLGRGADLVAAITEAEEDPSLAPLLAAALAGDVDLMSEAAPGDRIQVIVEKHSLGRDFHRYGRVLAVRYIGEATRVAQFHYKAPGAEAAYFDRDGKPTARAFLRSPIAWHRASGEGAATAVPRLEFLEGRVGASYESREGAPIVALADATVRAITTSPEAGLVVELELDDGTVHRYAHLRRTSGPLETGDRVRQGDVIALIGHTGKTPRPRLRLEVLDANGVALDPGMVLDRRAEVVPHRGEALTGDLLEQFDADVRPWHRALRQADGS
jgi:murein DD-endopeptidase MepM/ murein hydrolase activator NlpD